MRPLKWVTVRISGLSLFWTEARLRGFTFLDVTRLLSSAPAKLCGLQDRKGCLKEGMDADLVIWDPFRSFQVTPYLGKTLYGVVMRTIVRGNTVYQHDKPFPRPQGKLLIPPQLEVSIEETVFADVTKQSRDTTASVRISIELINKIKYWSRTLGGNRSKFHPANEELEGALPTHSKRDTAAYHDFGKKSILEGLIWYRQTGECISESSWMHVEYCKESSSIERGKDGSI
uniref:Amidohydrolase 3 domain-containing protein n=1 Tax=Timema tahoe TaxID=61484 RepID=A0A7R9FNY8_9NEOP|nr:unnamed protein product [Timema tahoe]